MDCSNDVFLLMMRARDMLASCTFVVQGGFVLCACSSSESDRYGVRWSGSISYRRAG